MSSDAPTIPAPRSPAVEAAAVRTWALDARTDCQRRAAGLRALLDELARDARPPAPVFVRTVGAMLDRAGRGDVASLHAAAGAVLGMIEARATAEGA